MRAAESTTQVRLARLTRRERECLELVAQHWRTKDIARQLGLSPATVDEYVRSAVRKLGTPDRAAAARVWLGLEAAPGPAAEAEAEEAPPADCDASGSLRSMAGDALVMAAKWSLLIGAAVGGVVVLMNAISQGLQVFPQYLSLHLMLGAVLWTLIPLGCVLAMIVGGLAERLAGSVGLTSFALTQVLNHGGDPPLGMVLTDVATTMALAAIAFGYRRRLLQVFAAMVFLCVVTHFAYGFLVGRGPGAMAYATVLNLWAYLGTAALVWSALTPDRHDRLVPTRKGALRHA